MKYLQQVAGLTKSPVGTYVLKHNATIQKLLNSIATWLFTLLCAWALGRTIWLLATPKSDDVIVKWKPEVTSVAPKQAATASSQYLIQALQGYNFFGNYINDPAVDLIKNAPKTQLKLTLVGVVATEDPVKGLAVIDNQGQQGTYGVGEKIDGTQVKLISVLPDRVIFNNQGIDETLMLDGVEFKKLRLPETPRKVVSSIPTNNPMTSDEKISALKKELSADPQKLFRYVRLSQIKKDGRVVGFSLSPGGEPALFNELGLKAGDVATKLNGQSLADPAAMAKLFQNMKNVKELSLTIERNGSPKEIFIEL